MDNVQGLRTTRPQNAEKTGEASSQPGTSGRQSAAGELEATPSPGEGTAAPAAQRAEASASASTTDAASGTGGAAGAAVAGQGRGPEGAAEGMAAADAEAGGTTGGEGDGERDAGRAGGSADPEDIPMPCADDLLSLMVVLLARARVHHLARHLAKYYLPTSMVVSPALQQAVHFSFQRIRDECTPLEHLWPCHSDLCAFSIPFSLYLLQVANAVFVDTFLFMSETTSHKGELGYALANYMAACECAPAPSLSTHCGACSCAGGVQCCSVPQGMGLVATSRRPVGLYPSSDWSCVDDCPQVRPQQGRGAAVHGVGGERVGVGRADAYSGGGRPQRRRRVCEARPARGPEGPSQRD